MAMAIIVFYLQATPITATWGWCRCARFAGEVFCSILANTRATNQQLSMVQVRWGIILPSKYLHGQQINTWGWCRCAQRAPNTIRSQLTPNLVRSGILLIAGGSIWQIGIIQPNMQAAYWLPQFGQIWHLIGWCQFDSTNGNTIFYENGPNQQETTKKLQRMGATRTIM